MLLLSIHKNNVLNSLFGFGYISLNKVVTSWSPQERNNNDTDNKWKPQRISKTKNRVQTKNKGQKICRIILHMKQTNKKSNNNTIVIYSQP